MTKKTKTVPLGTQISQEHWRKLEAMKTAGLNKNAVIEQGIDLVFAQLEQAGLLRDTGTCDDCGATILPKAA